MVSRNSTVLQLEKFIPSLQCSANQRTTDLVVKNISHENCKTETIVQSFEFNTMTHPAQLFKQIDQLELTANLNTVTSKLKTGVEDSMDSCRDEKKGVPNDDCTENFSAADEHSCDCCEKSEKCESNGIALNKTESTSTNCEELRAFLCIALYVAASVFLYTHLTNYFNSIDLADHTFYFYFPVVFVSVVWYGSISVIARRIHSCRARTVYHSIITV